jgi:hypothetical protein
MKLESGWRLGDDVVVHAQSAMLAREKGGCPSRSRNGSKYCLHSWNYLDSLHCAVCAIRFMVTLWGV